jgi:hypothetical protein
MDEKRVMFTVSHLKKMSAKHVLEQAGITTFILDKTDSAHAGIFGDIELYVDASQEAKARKILEEEELI